MRQELHLSEVPEQRLDNQESDVLLCITKTGEIRPFLVVDEPDDTLEYDERV